MSALALFNAVRVMDASLPHGDLLFATITQDPEDEGRVKGAASDVLAFFTATLMCP